MSCPVLSGQPDAGQLSRDEYTLAGGFWVDLCDTVRPFIVHSDEAPTASGLVTSPCSGYIDPRLESDNGVDLNIGIDRVTLAFTEPVYDAGSNPAALTPAAFTVLQTGGTPPGVLAINTADNTTVEVVFDRIIPLQEWTTVVADVQDACGNSIVSLGDLGPGQNEPDRVDIGFLPGDINNDGIVSPQDLINLRQFLTAGTYHPACGLDEEYFDIDRDGVMPEPQDLIRFRQMIAGTPPATRSWTLEEMNATQP